VSSSSRRAPQPFDKIQPVLAHAATHLDEDVSLETLARHAGLSPFHLQRIFAVTTGETPKQLTQRLRLGRAAVMLLTTDDSILNVALSCGFQSHEVFIRAFRRRFGMAPSAYRERGFALAAGADVAQTERHSELVEQVSPCIRLYHIGEKGPRRNDMTYAIAKKDLTPQPVLVVRRRIKPADLAKTLAEVLGAVFLHAQQNGMALTGQPFTRYIEWGPGMWTIEAGLPVASLKADLPPGSEVRAETLPGGPAAVTTHTGPYDGLSAAHAAVEQWIEAQKLKAAGAPWEVYVTDPADYPDAKDWRTDIFWPLVH